MISTTSRAAALGLAAAFGLSGGFLLRALTSDSPDPRPAAEPQETAAGLDPRTQKPSPVPGNLTASPATATPSDQPDLSMSDGVAKWLRWMAALESAGTGDIPGLVREMADNPAALAMVAARWIDRDPRHMFETLLTWPAEPRDGSPSVARNLLRSLLREWPTRDPHAVVEALTESHSPSASNWRMTVLSPLVENDPELGLRMFAEWNIDHFRPRATGIEKWARADPLHAARFTLEHRSGEVTELAMKAIGKVWAETAPGAALDFAASNPGIEAYHLGAEAMRHWAGVDLKEAAAWLARAEPIARRSLSLPFVEVLAADDPVAALEWCQESLDAPAIPEAVGAIVSSVASEDLPEAADMVGSLDPSPAKTSAAVEVAKKWFPRFDAVEPVPDEAVQWIATLDRNASAEVFRELSGQWLSNDRDGFADFLASEGAVNAPESAYNTLGNALAQQNPERAIDWLEHLPESRAPAAAQVVFRVWHEAQSAQAMAWLDELAAAPQQNPALVRGALRAIAIHRQGVEILQDLPASLRPAAREVITSSQLAPESQAALLEALAQ